MLQYPTIVTSYGPYEGSTPQVYFSLPADLSLVDPAWNGCIPDEYGAFDPPRTLSTASALTDPGDGAQLSTAAAPGSTISPAIVPATQTPDPKDPGATASQPSDGPISQLPSDSSTDPVVSSRSNSAMLQDTTSNPAPLTLGSGIDGQVGDRTSNIPSIHPNEDPGNTPTELSADPAQSFSSAIAAAILIPTASPTSPTKHIISTSIPSASISTPLPTNDGTSTQSTSTILVASDSIIRASNGDLIFGTSTITAGSHITISGHTIFAIPSSSVVIVDGTSYVLPTSVEAVIQHLPSIQALSGISAASDGATPSTLLLPGEFSLASSHPVLAFGGTASPVVTGAPTALTIAGQTAALGGFAITIDGTVLSLGSSALRIGSSTVALHGGGGQRTLTLEGGALPTALALALAGHTAALDGSAIAITIDGTTPSLASPSGSSTIPLLLQGADAQQAPASGMPLASMILFGFRGASRVLGLRLRVR